MEEFTRHLIDDTATRPDGGGRVWVLVGPRGAVHISFMKLPDIPGHVRDEEFFPGGFTGRDVGYHTVTPQRPGHRPYPGQCAFVPGGRCYQSGSSMPAQDLLTQWWKAGRDDEAMWQAAEWFYRAKFVDDLPGEVPSAEAAAWAVATTGLPLDIDRLEASVHPVLPPGGSPA